MPLYAFDTAVAGSPMTQQLASAYSFKVALPLTSPVKHACRVNHFSFNSKRDSEKTDVCCQTKRQKIQTCDYTILNL